MSTSTVDSIGEKLPENFHVSLIVQQSPSQNPWTESCWEVVGMVAGSAEALNEHPPVELIQERDGIRLYRHRGFTLRLHVDECESYYHNLMSPAPCAYVVATDQEGGAPQPRLVSLSFDEAHAYLEGDEALYTVAIPPEIYQWTEAFVLAHYVPEKRTKRKLRDWRAPEGEEA